MLWLGRVDKSSFTSRPSPLRSRSGGAFFFVVRGATTLILTAVVDPVVILLHVIDKPPSGTMGSIGFALTLASYGQDVFC